MNITWKSSWVGIRFLIKKKFNPIAHIRPDNPLCCTMSSFWIKTFFIVITFLVPIFASCFLLLKVKHDHDLCNVPKIHHCICCCIVFYGFFNNISSVVEFQRWWVLKSNIFGQESTYSWGKKSKKFLRGMSVHQKLGIILESKVVQNWI